MRIYLEFCDTYVNIENNGLSSDEQKKLSAAISALVFIDFQAVDEAMKLADDRFCHKGIQTILECFDTTLFCMKEFADDRKPLRSFDMPDNLTWTGGTKARSELWGNITQNEYDNLMTYVASTTNSDDEAFLRSVADRCIESFFRFKEIIHPKNLSLTSPSM